MGEEGDEVGGRDGVGDGIDVDCKIETEVRVKDLMEREG